MQFEELTLEDKVKRVKSMFKSYKREPLSYTGFYKSANADNLIYRIYASTNENLNYFKQLASFKGKDVLVPTASGDHALNAILLGAKSVETFDINSIAKYHSDLKFTAIKYLTKNEFLKFYSYNYLFNRDTYNKFRAHLQDETKYFFDEIYKYVEKEGPNLAYFGSLSPMLEEVYPDIDKDLIFNNAYLKNDYSYRTLKNKLLQMETPIKHKVCPADELLENFDKKDIIIMSNIYSIYLAQAQNPKPYIEEIPRLLNENGTASVNYLYAATHPNSRDILMDRMDNLNLKYRKINIVPKWTKYHSYDVIYAADKNDNTIEK